MTPTKMTLVQIADALGAADAQRKDAEARVAALKAELRKRRVEVAEGNAFSITITTTTSLVLDQAEVKEYLRDRLPEFQRLTEVTRFSIKPVLQFGEAA